MLSLLIDSCFFRLSFSTANVANVDVTCTVVIMVVVDVDDAFLTVAAVAILVIHAAFLADDAALLRIIR